ncbi:MAG: hypothetical protein IPK97_17150 [Ahniella sp.]|nr:hypothetical protein [Ahniella sp.]
MLNPNPVVEAVPLYDGHHCWIIDDALTEPERWVAKAAAHRAEFAELGVNAYPGPELRLPDGIAAAFSDLFRDQFRHRLGLRRIQRAYTRLSMVTWPADRLEPRQWICHRDRFGLPAHESAAASVLYLFESGRFGGTRFFRPRRPVDEINRLVHDSGVLDAAAFQQKYGIQRGYIEDGNDWFECVANIPARFNRLICYDGTLFHSSDIRRGDPLSDDPAQGRLTLNGFFLCSRAAT